MKLYGFTNCVVETALQTGRAYQDPFNDITLDAPDDDAYDLVIAIASGLATYQETASRLASWH